MARALTLGIVLAVVAATATGARAEAPAGLAAQLEGTDAKIDEMNIIALLEANKLLEVRDSAEKFLTTHPNSSLANYALGVAFYLGESNLPKAKYYLSNALRWFEKEHGVEPTAEWEWHARMLRLLADVVGNMDDYRGQIQLMRRFNERYTPRYVAEFAWPLMKLRQFEAARAAAQEGLAANDAWQTIGALNALCAIEFESHNDEASFEACARAVEYSEKAGSGSNSVDYSNYAEAARTVFRLDAAERVLMKALKASQALYGNPWVDLSDLYIRAGRFGEVASALKNANAYRLARPAVARDQDVNEQRRVIATFYLLIGMLDEAAETSERARVLVDRRSHTSRDKEQDACIIALLDREAQLSLAERAGELAAADVWYKRWWSQVKSLKHRVQALIAGWAASRELREGSRMVGIFAIGTSSSAVTPPWLIGDLVEVLGHGVAKTAIERAVAQDHRSLAPPYYKAMLAEAALQAGSEVTALKLGQDALRDLSRGDSLLRARVDLLMFLADERSPEAAEHLEQVLQVDPGLLRRQQVEVPVRIEAGSTESARELARAVRRSPRFKSRNDAAFVVRVTDTSACLSGPTGTNWGCGHVSDQPPEGVELEAPIARALYALHEAVFRPRVNLSQLDINSLDGSNETTRSPLEDLLGE